MPNPYAAVADACASENHAVEHSIEDGLRYVRPFNQRPVFQAGADTASAEGVCIGCSALFLKNNKPWREFKAFLTSEAGKAKARLISNALFQRESDISKHAAEKRKTLADSTPPALRHQERSVGQYVKSAFGFGNDAARAEARRAEREFNARTVEDAHKQRLASYQQCLREQLRLEPGTQRTGPDGAFTGIPSGLFDSGFAPLRKEEAGCLIGMWVQIGERAGRLSGGHAFAVKPTQDVDGYAVFDPNYGEVIFESASDCSYFLGGFIGRANQFVNGAWMIQQYVGCSPAAEEIDDVFGGLGRLAGAG